MFHWLFTNLPNKVSVSHEITISQGTSTRGPSVVSGRTKSSPMEFARATNGFIYMADGLGPVLKWDGIANEARQAGVPAPQTAVTLAGSGSGSLTGTYNAYQRWLDEDSNASNLSPIQETVTVDGVLQFDFSNVEAATDNRVVKRQILRNTSGQATVYYVDIETEDLTATTFSSTRTDDDLSLQTVVPLFDSEGRSIANRNGIPRSDKPIIAFYSGRLFLAGDKQYREGHARVTSGSKTVTGVGTQWNESMVSRFFYARGSEKRFEIESVDEASQQITLAEVFTGATNKFSEYVIRSAPSERTTLAYSEAGQFDAWPSLQAIEVSSSDDLEDEITGLMPTKSFLYIAQRRHIYRLTFLADPIADGAVFLSARRGCVNNRCWVNVDGWTYMLDDRGIHRFSGGDNTEDLSQAIQDLFYLSGGDNNEFRINWDAQEFFHANHDRNRSLIRWFVAFSGSSLPRHALALNYANGQFWIEEYPHPVGDSEEIRQDVDIPVSLGPSSTVYAVGVGNLDVVEDSADVVRTPVSSSSLNSIVSGNEEFPADSVLAPISIVEGRGKGQTRVISSISGHTARIETPWSILPDTTSKFQVGGIAWRWRSGIYRFVMSEVQQKRRIATSFRRSDAESTMDVRMFRDFSDDPEPWGLDFPRTPWRIEWRFDQAWRP